MSATSSTRGERAGRSGASPAAGTIRVTLLVRPALRRAGRVLLPSWLAITLGRTIVSWRPLDVAERAHELCHARQWEAAGRFRYPLSYAAASFRARRSGGHWYHDNTYEIEARAAADAVRAGRAMESRALPGPG